jgi:hypothetical protein
MLIAQAMGLGGWIHAAVGAPYVFERDPANGKFGIEFRMQQPKKWRRWPPLPTTQPNPIGIDGLLESLTPPYVKSMDEAVDRVVEESYGPAGTYGDNGVFDRSYQKSDYGDACLKMAAKRPRRKPWTTRRKSATTSTTHGRFPRTRTRSTCRAWLQFSHLKWSSTTAILTAKGDPTIGRRDNGDAGMQTTSTGRGTPTARLLGLLYDAVRFVEHLLAAVEAGSSQQASGTTGR